MEIQPLWAVGTYIVLLTISCLIGTVLVLKALHSIWCSRQRKQILTMFPFIVFLLLIATVHCTVLIPILIVQEATMFSRGNPIASLIPMQEFLWVFCQCSIVMSVSVISIKRAKIMLQMRARNAPNFPMDFILLVLTVIISLSLAVYLGIDGTDTTWLNYNADLIMVGISACVLFTSYGLTVVFLIHMQQQLGQPIQREISRRNGEIRASNLELTHLTTLQSTCRDIVPYRGPLNTQNGRIFTISESTSIANSLSPSTFGTLLRKVTPRMMAKRSNSVCPEKEVVTDDTETGLQKPIKVSLGSVSSPHFKNTPIKTTRRNGEASSVKSPKGSESAVFTFDTDATIHASREGTQGKNQEDEEQTLVKNLNSPSGSEVSEVFASNTDDFIHKRQINDKKGKDYSHRHMSVPGCVNDFSDSEDEETRRSRSEDVGTDSSMSLVPYVSSITSITSNAKTMSAKLLKTPPESPGLSLNIDLPPTVRIHRPPDLFKRMDSESDISVIQLSPTGNIPFVFSQSQKTSTDEHALSNSPMPLPPWFHRRPPPPGFCTSGTTTPSTLSRQSSRGRIQLPPLKHLSDNLNSSASSWSTKSNYNGGVGDSDVQNGYRYRYRNRLPLQAYNNCLTTDYSSSTGTGLSSGYPKKSLSTRPSSGNMTNHLAGLHDPDGTESDMSLVLYQPPENTTGVDSEDTNKALDEKSLAALHNCPKPPFNRNNSNQSIMTLTSLASSGNERTRGENTSLSDIDEVKIHSDISRPWAFRISAGKGPGLSPSTVNGVNPLENGPFGPKLSMFYPSEMYKHFLAHEFRSNMGSTPSSTREIVSIEEVEENSDKSSSMGEGISPNQSCIITFPGSGSSDDDTIKSTSAQNSAGIIPEDAKSNIYLTIATNLGSESSDYDLPRSGGWIPPSEPTESIPQMAQSSANLTSSMTVTGTQSLFQSSLNQSRRSRSHNVFIALRKGTLLLCHLILTLLPFAILKSQENHWKSEHFYPVLLLTKGITSIFYVLCPVAYFYANKGLKTTVSRS